MRSWQAGGCWGTLPRRLLPNPARLFRLFEDGKLTRAQWQAAMAWHASQILEEVADVLGARRAALWVADREANRLVLAAAVGDQGIEAPIDLSCSSAWPTSW